MPSPNGPADSWRWACYGVPFAVAATLATPLLLTWLAGRKLFSKRPLVGIGAKLTGACPAVAPGKILVHGVSLGETALMRPLVPRLEAALGTGCLLTTTTETDWQGLGKSFPDHPRAFLPFDLPWAVARFLDATKPRAVVLLESEFWPLLVLACHRRGIPVVVANARMSERSFTRLGRLPLVRPLLAGYAGAAAQNALFAERLSALGIPRVAVTGTMKADLVKAADPAAARAEATRTGLDPAKPLLLLASTSPGEEAAVLAGRLPAWQARGWQVAIAPRHPERGMDIAALVSAWGGTPRRTSQGQTVAAGEVAIVDEIGRLGALYALAANSGIAVVGGSLGSGRGGQNMLEAAAAGCATVVGWDVVNQPDAMALLRAADGVVEVTAGTAQDALEDLAGDAPRRQRLGLAGKQAWQAGLGAADRTAAHLVGILAGR